MLEPSPLINIIAIMICTKWLQVENITCDCSIRVFERYIREYRSRFQWAGQFLAPPLKPYPLLTPLNSQWPNTTRELWRSVLLMRAASNPSVISLYYLKYILYQEFQTIAIYIIYYKCMHDIHICYKSHYILLKLQYYISMKVKLKNYNVIRMTFSQLTKLTIGIHKS